MFVVPDIQGTRQHPSRKCRNVDGLGVPDGLESLMHCACLCNGITVGLYKVYLARMLWGKPGYVDITPGTHCLGWKFTLSFKKSTSSRYFPLRMCTYIFEYSLQHLNCQLTNIRPTQINWLRTTYIQDDFPDFESVDRDCKKRGRRVKSNMFICNVTYCYYMHIVLFWWIGVFAYFTCLKFCTYMFPSIWELQHPDRNVCFFRNVNSSVCSCSVWKK